MNQPGGVQSPPGGFVRTPEIYGGQGPQPGQPGWFPSGVYPQQMPPGRAYNGMPMLNPRLALNTVLRTRQPNQPCMPNTGGGAWPPGARGQRTNMVRGEVARMMMEPGAMYPGQPGSMMAGGFASQQMANPGYGGYPQQNISATPSAMMEQPSPGILPQSFVPPFQGPGGGSMGMQGKPGGVYLTGSAQQQQFAQAK